MAWIGDRRGDCHLPRQVEYHIGALDSLQQRPVRVADVRVNHFHAASVLPPQPGQVLLRPGARKVIQDRDLPLPGKIIIGQIASNESGPACDYAMRHILAHLTAFGSRTVISENKYGSWATLSLAARICPVSP